MTCINDELGIYVNHVMVNDWAKWRHDIRHNDIQHNNIRHNDIRDYDIQINDIQHHGLNYDIYHK